MAADIEIITDDFEIIKSHGGFLVRRNNALLAEILAVKDRARRNLGLVVSEAQRPS